MRKETFLGNYARLVTAGALMTTAMNGALFPSSTDEQPLKLEIIFQHSDQVIIFPPSFKKTLGSSINDEGSKTITITVTPVEIPPGQMTIQKDESGAFLDRGIQTIAPPQHSGEALASITRRNTKPSPLGFRQPNPKR